MSDFTPIQERIRKFAEDSLRRGRLPKTKIDTRNPEPSANAFACEVESTEASGPSQFPFVGNERQDRLEGIAITFQDYLELLDWIGRAFRQQKQGHIPCHLAPILRRLGYSPEQWLAAAGGFQRLFGPFAGASERLRSLAQTLGRKWLCGVGLGCVRWAEARLIGQTGHQAQPLIALPQLFRQLFRFQMRVPPQHAQVFVAGDGRYLHDIEAMLEQACGRLVAQIVEVQVLDVSAAGGAGEGAFDRLGREAGEHLAVGAAGQCTQGFHGRAG